MSQKKYPWKPRHAKLSHRGRKEGRKPHNLAAEEHLARYVYDDLRTYSPHEHIENPCYGLDPKKVRDGQCGSTAYRRTARALMTKTYLNGYLNEEGLGLKTGTELVPLLRKCTNLEDGHLNLPKIVRHLVALYYIVCIDPNWLIDSIPFYRNPAFYCCSLANVLPFYLFRELPFKCIFQLQDEEIFRMVDTKLKHIIKNQKDDGERARWKPCVKDYQPAQASSQAKLLRLYGGNPKLQMVRDAINEARLKGTLMLASGKSGSNNVQVKRKMKLERTLQWQLSEYSKKDKIEHLIAMRQEQLNLAKDAGNDKKIHKLENNLASLQKWHSRQYERTERASRFHLYVERCLIKGNLPYFHNLHTVCKNNVHQVIGYVLMHKSELDKYAHMSTLIKQNFEAGSKGEEMPNFITVKNLYSLPNRDGSLCSIYLLGAVIAGHQELPGFKGTITLRAFADKYHEEIRQELAGHGIVRHEVLALLYAKPSEHGNNGGTACPQSAKALYLNLLGMSHASDIVKLGNDYAERSRNLLKSLVRFDTLASEEILLAKSAYRTKNERSGIKVVRSFRYNERDCAIEAVPIGYERTESPGYYQTLARRSYEVGSHDC